MNGGGMEIDHLIRSPSRCAAATATAAAIDHASLAECHSSLKRLEDGRHLQATTNRYQAKINRELRLRIKNLSAKVEELEARNLEERERNRRLEGKVSEILSLLSKKEQPRVTLKRPRAVSASSPLFFRARDAAGEGGAGATGSVGERREAAGKRERAGEDGDNDDDDDRIKRAKVSHHFHHFHHHHHQGKGDGEQGSAAFLPLRSLKTPPVGVASSSVAGGGARIAFGAAFSSFV